MLWFRILVSVCLLTITGILVYEVIPFQDYWLTWQLHRHHAAAVRRCATEWQAEERLKGHSVTAPDSCSRFSHDTLVRAVTWR